MNIKPLEDRILVKPLEGGETKKGGIIIPDSAKEKPEEGKVIAVGAGKILENGTKKPLSVKKGDTVMFAKYAGNEITIDGDKHLIMREEDVLAIIEK
ncbi:MAG: co-chaperone GroES [Candidatus Firestonebacteria bacterium RIFOXYC2_FULL_39_67]|nr:MAG: co-chaperone GroES [Candidatus Firestonebacteria bacterium RIFOXYD2_FULL_39_29]OGF56785.1 MAG: co-chaperone GroES [Candidatus Firestonebacteria bacterium RIFOXYC2_FULL_39_67]OGF57829.1 MAG: co-chaperone GroES [Candidatus Firestonebacteria bacterium RifOxyC12_full_39_7]